MAEELSERIRGVLWDGSGRCVHVSVSAVKVPAVICQTSGSGLPAVLYCDLPNLWVLRILLGIFLTNVCVCVRACVRVCVCVCVCVLTVFLRGKAPKENNGGLILLPRVTELK